MLSADTRCRSSRQQMPVGVRGNSGCEQKFNEWFDRLTVSCRAAAAAAATVTTFSTQSQQPTTHSAMDLVAYLATLRFTV